MGITKDAEVVICFVYKMYLERRKNGVPKRDAIRFDDDFYKSDRVLSEQDPRDISTHLLELARNGYIKIYIGGNFDLLDTTIIYMENRFKKGITDVLSFLAQFIP